MQTHLHGNAAVDKTPELRECLLEAAFMVLFPVAVIAEGARVFPDPVEGAGATVEKARAPPIPASSETRNHRPRAVGKQHIAFAVQVGNMPSIW